MLSHKVTSILCELRFLCLKFALSENLNLNGSGEIWLMPLTKQQNINNTEGQLSYKKWQARWDQTEVRISLNH